MKSILALALSTVALASPVPAEPASVSPPSYKIKNVIHGGSGCKQGTIDIDFSDSTIFPIYFTRDYSTAIGPNVGVDQNRKNCQLGIELAYSAGYSFAVYSTDFSGWADIDSGVKALVKSTYYFAGQTAEGTSSTTLTGPFSGKYTKHDDVAISSWSPCSGSAIFNVNAEIALTASAYGASGTVVAVKESGRFGNSLYIKWKQC